MGNKLINTTDCSVICSNVIFSLPPSILDFSYLLSPPILDWGAAIESLYFNQYLHLMLSKFTITPTIMFKTLQQIKENNSCENLTVSDI